MATYQALDVDTDESDANFLVANYPENYFSHIVIDECHRSAWGKWSQVMLRNPEAVQIGLTATPRKIETAERNREAAADLVGVDVRVTPAGHYIATDVDGRAIPVTVEEYKAKLARALVEAAPTLAEFRSLWVQPGERRALIDRLPDSGRSAGVIQQREEMQAYDLFDVLGELGYGLAPKTREERAAAFQYKHAAWLVGLPSATARVLKALARQFARAGTTELESPSVFQTRDVARAGGVAALRELGQPAEVLMQTKERMFAA